MIAKYIEYLNKKNRKVLSVFLTAGFPDVNKFVRLALEMFDKGADMLEIGIPFSDPIADGPVIQHASQKALAAGVTIDRIFKFVQDIRRYSDKPLILMGYANPILSYGVDIFLKASRDCGVNGLIVPDIPLEEYHSFWGTAPREPDIILLTTPTSPVERIKAIDRHTQGFVYCVSMTGTTGISNKFDGHVMEHIKKTYELLIAHKMLIGFGISGARDVERFAPYCDGVIVGSSVIRRLITDGPDDSYASSSALIKELSNACNS